MPNFFNEIILLTFLALTIFIFKGYQGKNFKLVSQQYTGWSDCMDVQAGLALYWWQSLITFSVGRIRVKFFARGYFPRYFERSLCGKFIISPTRYTSIPLSCTKLYTVLHNYFSLLPCKFICLRIVI